MTGAPGAWRTTLHLVALPALMLGILVFFTETWPSFYFPRVEAVFNAFVREWMGARLLQDVLPSLVRLAAGYLLAVAFGVGVGVVVGLRPVLHQALEPVFDFIRAIPPPALIPVMFLLAGFGSTMKILVIVSGALWPVLMNTVVGIRGCDTVLRQTASSFHIRGWDYLRHVAIPAASPLILAGMRISLSVAIILMVVSEMFAASDGLGSAIIRFQRGFAVPEMWSGVFLLGLIGFLLSKLFDAFERRTLRWYHGLRRMDAGS